MPNLPEDDGRRAPARADEPSVPYHRSPSRYADAFLEQVGLGSLKDWYRIVQSDQGTPVSVIRKRLGEGICWLHSADGQGPSGENSWLVLERLIEGESSILRARLFGSLEGATAEFCLRLKTHDSGCVAFHEVRGDELRASNSCFQLEFYSPTRQMLLSHRSVAMMAASRLMVG